MYHSKKFFSLVTTCIVGFSTVVSIIPVSALADTSKTGNTVLTYDGTPQPKEWVLYVPSQIKIDGYKDNTYTWSNATIAIVNQDGSSPFKDTTRAHSFVISGVANHINSEKDRMELVNDKDGTKTAPLLVGVAEQGSFAPCSL